MKSEHEVLYSVFTRGHAMGQYHTSGTKFPLFSWVDVSWRQTTCSVYTREHVYEGANDTGLLITLKFGSSYHCKAEFTLWHTVFLGKTLYWCHACHNQSKNGGDAGKMLEKPSKMLPFLPWGGGGGCNQCKESNKTPICCPCLWRCLTPSVHRCMNWPLHLIEVEVLRSKRTWTKTNHW